MKRYQKSLDLHEMWQGKLEITVKAPINNAEDLSQAYSPGVAGPCIEIANEKDSIYKYTMKGNTVAVISNGTAVLGLGDIGAEAAIPVMEGKSALFKRFAGINSVPLCLDTRDAEDFIRTVKNLAPVFGGINLEDIAAPDCFYIEERLKEELDIPVFHDDQHGTAIVVAAALLNAGKLVGKEISEMKIVINGAGAAGIAIAKLLHSFEANEIIVCDTKGAIYKGRPLGMNGLKDVIAEFTNLQRKRGDLSDVIQGADVFIGVSAAGALTAQMIKSMDKDSIVFALANPTPEIMPEEAKLAGVRVIGTGRSDYPNQINNLLAFPGIFKGALQVRASQINEDMKREAAKAIASLVSIEELSEEYVVPNPFDSRVVDSVAQAVAMSACRSGKGLLCEVLV
ncbi:NAD-dependent malic enzyme [Sporosarcina luteola]|uniref:NAD(P)-dependent malic enzyme n=1 Tax=Sporosarcina luteola TaxID=582850 RepID=UPI00203ADF8D|nr:malic enzyme-like NAD(P)-binding protein [Sporosarcina luteola]MCM3744037.1 NAD-dependent malic enzyme [Sporosarcina luteola]